LLNTFLLICMGANMQARSQHELSGSFDLVIYGQHLGEHLAVSVKANPKAGSEWQQLGEKENIFIGKDGELMIIQGLSLSRYFGQDIRENYIAIKLIPDAQDKTTGLAALYAVSPLAELDMQTGNQLKMLIENHPVKMKDGSLASYVRPRPYQLKNGKAFIGHIEAPVRHYKPGVREVQWLEVLFGD
ncbi:MAG: hypothetical protein K9I94_07695, partial [Bacteroidales bacterium]|nr:hypothetical protein [Bacteroidales bacterium]